MDYTTLSQTGRIMYWQRGVSLLEIVIAVAIISIIAAVAWPWYERYQQKVYRSDCIAGLEMAANDLERCGARNGGNFTERLPGGVVRDCTITSPALQAAGGGFRSPNGRCTITPAIGRLGVRYTLTAALIAPENPNPDEVIADNALCGDLSLDHLNVRRITGSSTVAYCWN